MNADARVAGAFAFLVRRRIWIVAFYALLVATFLYRAMSFSALYGVLSESARATASVGLVIGASLIFNYIVASENIPAKMELLLRGLDVTPLMFLLGGVLFLRLALPSRLRTKRAPVRAGHP